MKYAVDRIENDIAILENIDTKEKVEVSINNLPNNIKEGSILIFVDNTYQHDSEEEKNRYNRIRNKFNTLKK